MSGPATPNRNWSGSSSATSISDDARPDVTLKTYDIEGVPQSTISSIIGQVLTTPKYAFSPDGKRLVLWAEDEEHQLVDSIVNNLTDDDFRAANGQVAVFKVQPLSTSAARAPRTDCPHGVVHRHA
ncbi:MAG: hypothetical protein R3B91_20475 [Planctomycetaceae bacterium]